MQNASTYKNQPCLTRLALITDDITDINPYSVLDDFFSFGDRQQMKDLFMAACQASLSEKYSWKEGSAGNLLYFYERLETLVEASFLILTVKRQKKKLTRKIRHRAAHATLKTLLPCALSEERDPKSIYRYPLFLCV